jgi:hypothetical protein
MVERKDGGVGRGEGGVITPGFFSINREISVMKC